MRIHPAVPTVLTTFLAGYMAGRLVTALVVANALPLTVTPGALPAEVPVVILSHVEDQQIVGEIRGDVRFIAADAPVAPDASGAIAFPIAPFLKNYVETLIPEGAAFVASRKGTRYYPVHAAAADRIVPGNRVYFPTAAQAEAAGFTRGK